MALPTAFFRLMSCSCLRGTPNFDQPYSWSDLDQFPYFYPKVQGCPNTSDVWCSISEPNATFEDEEIYTEAVRRLTYAKSVEAQRPFFVNVGFHKVSGPSAV